MDNKELEKELGKIKELKEVPTSVDEKIQKAFQTIEENEKEEKESRKIKFSFNRVLSVAACLIMVIFLAGNGAAYAYGMPNIYSWILEKIGIAKEYEEIKTDINKTVENNGIKVTLYDAGYDANNLILALRVEDLSGKIKELRDRYKCDDLFFDGSYTLYTNKDEVITDSDYSEGTIIFKQLTDKEYLIYHYVTISEVVLEGVITKADIQLNSIMLEERKEKISGDWKFKIEGLKDKYSEPNYCIIDVDKQIDDYITINSVRIENSGILGKLHIYYEFNSRMPENRYYLIKVVDNEKNILYEEKFLFDGYDNINKYLTHLEKNEEYKILIYSNEENEVLEEIKFIYTNFRKTCENSLIEIDKTIISDGIEITLKNIGCYNEEKILLEFLMKDKEKNFLKAPVYEWEFDKERSQINYMIRTLMFSEYYEIYSKESNESVVIGNWISPYDGNATTKFMKKIGNNSWDTTFSVGVLEDGNDAVVLYKEIDLSEINLNVNEITELKIYLDSIYSDAQISGGELTEPISQGDWYFNVDFEN